MAERWRLWQADAEISDASGSQVDRQQNAIATLTPTLEEKESRSWGRGDRCAVQGIVLVYVLTAKAVAI